jgi:uncharacterized membrane protein (TIGR02234 family)
MSPARRLTGTVVALGLASVALWSSSRLVWLRADFHSPLRGQLTLTTTGAQLKPELVGLALFALAGIAGLVAVRGWARRLVALLLGLAGVWAVWLAVDWLLGATPGSLGDVVVPAGAVPAGAVPDGPLSRTSAPLLVLAAGALVVIAAVFMVRWAEGMPGLGSRYAAPAAARRSPDREGGWWHALDEGQDPTVRSRTADPGPPA